MRVNGPLHGALCTKRASSMCFCVFCALKNCVFVFFDSKGKSRHDLQGALRTEEPLSEATRYGTVHHSKGKSLPNYTTCEVHCAPTKVPQVRLQVRTKERMLRLERMSLHDLQSALRTLKCLNFCQVKLQGTVPCTKGRAPTQPLIAPPQAAMMRCVFRGIPL